MARQRTSRTEAPTRSAGQTARRQVRAEPRSLVMPRAVARAIDTVAVGGPAIVLGVLLGQSLSVGFVVAVLLAAYLYEAVSVARFGATPGKAWVGLEIVDAGTGRRPPVSQAGTRILFVLAAAGALHLMVPIGPAAAVFLWGSATTKRDGRGLPDTVAGTRVVRRGEDPRP